LVDPDLGALSNALSLVWTGAMMALFFFGDQVMQLLFKGTITLPPY
jgi:hypothetical protein